MTKEEILKQLQQGYDNFMCWGVDAYVIDKDNKTFRAATSEEIEELLKNPTLEVTEKTVPFEEIKKQFYDVFSQEEIDALNALVKPVLSIPNNVEWDADKWLEYSKTQPLVLDNSEETDKFKASIDLDNCHWMILDEEKAKELHIDIIKIDENHAIISADIAFIPDGVSIEEYCDYLQETGILINNKTLKEKYGSNKIFM